MFLLMEMPIVKKKTDHVKKNCDFMTFLLKNWCKTRKYFWDILEEDTNDIYRIKSLRLAEKDLWNEKEACCKCDNKNIA